MTYHRHRGHEETSGAVVAIGALLVLLAGGVLYGAYRWVRRREPTPAAAAPASDEVGLIPADGDNPAVAATPFDKVEIDAETDAFVMIVDVPTPPTTPAEVDRVAHAVDACLAYEDKGGLYPEAEGRTRIVRVVFDHPPTPAMLARLRGKRIQVWVYGPDQKQHPLREVVGGAGRPDSDLPPAPSGKGKSDPDR